MQRRRPTDREHGVLIPLLSKGGTPAILLTRRPRHPRDPYAGQVCLPGGAREAPDATLADCALREAREEVGLPPDQVEIIAELGWHSTSIHHRVKPFVALVTGRFRPVLQPDEVAEILYLPLGRLGPELFEIRAFCKDDTGTERTVLTFDLDGNEVWGLTARILHSLCIEHAELLERIQAGGVGGLPLNEGAVSGTRPAPPDSRPPAGRSLDP